MERSAFLCMIQGKYRLSVNALGKEVSFVDNSKKEELFRGVFNAVGLLCELFKESIVYL